MAIVAELFEHVVGIDTPRPHPHLLPHYGQRRPYRI